MGKMCPNDHGYIGIDEFYCNDCGARGVKPLKCLCGNKFYRYHNNGFCPCCGRSITEGIKLRQELQKSRLQKLIWCLVIYPIIGWPSQRTTNE
ncbi:MAG: hypothetical protein WCT16_03670 [Candidatus Buchananbacteria bacterium]